MQEKFTFDLQNKIKTQLKVDGKNDIVEVIQLYLSAPTYKQKDLTLVLKKKFIEAIFAMTNSVSRSDAEKTVQSEESELDAKAAKAIIFGAKDFDIVYFFGRFEQLLLKVCFKDEDMTQAILPVDISKLNESDFEDLLAKYLEVFFLSSWMKTLS